MTMELIDRSNYLKGLLILIRRDKILTKTEKSLVIEAGVNLGFERRFCEVAVEELLENEYLSDSPPVFSNSELAEYFLHDAVKVALADKMMHIYELQWLIEFCEHNTLPASKVEELIKYYISHNSTKMDAGEIETKKQLMSL